MSGGLQQLAVDALSRTPLRPAIQFDGQWITWGELNDLATSISSLLKKSGIHGTAPVAVILRNRPWAIAALLSLVADARNVQMIYAFQSPAGIARDIERLKPAALISGVEDFSPEVLRALEQHQMAAVAVDGLAAHTPGSFGRAGRAAERTGPESRQIEVFTSGTTGPPKQFPVAHEMIFRHFVPENGLPFLDDQEALRIPPLLLFLPLGNISGLYGLFPPILKGQRGILLDRFSIEAWHEFVLEYRPVTSGIPPSYYPVLLDSGIPKEDLSSIKFLVAGAAPVDPGVQRAFEEKYGIPVLPSYGATEFGGPVTLMTPEDYAKFGRSKIESVGRPFAGARLRVVDPKTGESLPAGEEGLLEVSSPRIGTHWIKTTDLGMIDEDGFVYHRGRADGAIVRGGFKLLPETIEKALKLHPAVSDAVVVALPDRRLGQVPAAAIVSSPGRPADEASLEAHLRERVTKPHIPVRWLFFEDYPRNASLKIDRRAIGDLFRDEKTPAR